MQGKVLPQRRQVGMQLKWAALPIMASRDARGCVWSDGDARYGRWTHSGSGGDGDAGYGKWRRNGVSSDGDADDGKWTHNGSGGDGDARYGTWRCNGAAKYGKRRCTAADGATSLPKKASGDARPCRGRCCPKEGKWGCS